MGIFKAYDIRGIYGTDLDEDIAYKIGRSFVIFLKCKKVLIGQDARTSSPKLFKALTNGIRDQGADVVNIGQCSTPMFYFSCQGYEAGIMVTASHNPAKYNGFKLVRKDAVPISGESGIKDIETYVEMNIFPEADNMGSLEEVDMLDKFIEYNLKFIKTDKPLRIVVDAANGMGAYTFPKIFKELPFDFVPLYCDVDMSFPNHEANPLKTDTLKDLQKAVLENKADLGIALDGDADRCAFVDEKGEIVRSDFAAVIVAEQILKNYPKSKILFDLRSSKVVPEIIKSKGGKPIMTRVGHVFIKEHMRKEKAVFAGELSGHYYYKDNFFTESSFLTSAIIINLLSEENNPLSEIVKPLKKYFQSGEINSEVDDKDKKLKQLQSHFHDADNIFHLDGLSVEFKDWWFNVRKSNTESLLRLNVEADSKELMEVKTKELLGLIRN